jgi:hexokinase
VNDTVGTLMANAYRRPDTSLGIILGTGTNAGKSMKKKIIIKILLTYNGSLLRKTQEYHKVEGRRDSVRGNGSEYGMGSVR